MSISTRWGACVDIMVGGGHAMLSSLLAEVLGDRGYRVVASGTSEELLEHVRRSPPAVCLVHDLRAEVEVEVVRALTAAGRGRCRIVVVSARESHEADGILERGATGLVGPGCDIDDLMTVLDGVVRGRRVMKRASATPRSPHTGPTDAVRLASALTARERECLALLVDGVGTADMADRLNVSTMTVRSHVRSVLTKLGVHSRLEAASFAVRWGLLAVPPTKVSARRARAS